MGDPAADREKAMAAVRASVRNRRKETLSICSM